MTTTLGTSSLAGTLPSQSRLPRDRSEQLSALLTGVVEQLDLSAADFRAAEQRYTHLGAHLAGHGAVIYVQGSVMLGTVTAPYGRWGEFDLDLVCRWDVAKASTTQARLKERVGELLSDYVETAEEVDGEPAPTCSEGRRSWTLHFERFHMDVLPAIPDMEVPSRSAIELTDKQLRLWQKSDPRAYVEWFRSRCSQQILLERKALAHGGRVEDVPVWRVRTPLHRTVQVLKRHRDVAFHNDHDDQPPSSLITTLAARAYEGQPDLLGALLEVVEAMPDFIERRNGRYWVPNPACEQENFADKWNDYPQRRATFFSWRDRVLSDLRGVLGERGGATSVHQRLESVFGQTIVREALKASGAATHQLRRSGGLAVAGAGLLTSGAGRPVPEHRFYGGPARF